MKTPTFSIIIPTAGRGDLPMTIHSINTQGLVEGDEILVIGDGTQHEAQDQIEALGEPYRYLEAPKTGDWGHTPCNYALPFCTADYVMIQGDDDIFLPRAFEIIRKAILANPGDPKPLMFRFYTNDRWLVWAEEDSYDLGPALVGDHNLIAPNNLEKLGRWEAHYRGDLAYVRGTAGFYGGSSGMLWCKEIISRQRPSIQLFDWPVGTAIPDEQNPGYRSLSLENASQSDRICRYRFSPRDSTETIAVAKYGISDRFWASISLAPEFYGKGYGRELVQHAIDAAQGDCWMEVASEDTSVLSLLNELGFIRMSEGARVQLVRKFPP